MNRRTRSAICGSVVAAAACGDRASSAIAPAWNAPLNPATDLDAAAAQSQDLDGATAIVGAALKSGALKSIDVPITQLLWRSAFASDSDVARLCALRLENVMGMSALNVDDPPRNTSAAASQHQDAFWFAKNRVTFATKEPLLRTPGVDFLYNDETPLLAAGVVQYATSQTLLDFGKAALFDSLAFVNEEWMQQDSVGIDMGGYGFRMRPMDMQKLGLLYLHGGSWKGRQLPPAD